MSQALDNRRDLRGQDLGSEPARSNATPMHGWHLRVTKSLESLLLLDSDEAVDLVAARGGCCAETWLWDALGRAVIQI